MRGPSGFPLESCATCGTRHALPEDSRERLASCAICGYDGPEVPCPTGPHYLAPVLGEYEPYDRENGFTRAFYWACLLVIAADLIALAVTQ